jgi:hypothetical protein
MGESLSLFTCREKLCYEMVERVNYQRHIFVIGIAVLFIFPKIFDISSN